MVRYEEDDPALLYNGVYDWRVRPQSWSANKTMTTVSDGWHVYSGVAGDTVSLTFDGSWAAVGFRVRNVTSQAEIFMDGVSQGVLDLQNPDGEDVRSYQFGGLMTGTHTISVSVAAGTVYFDYFDVWDGQTMSDELVNASRAEDNGRLHYTSNLIDAANANAIDGDMVVPSLGYADSNIWFTFVGDSFTLLGVTYINDSSVDVYIDGVWVDTRQFQYPYTEQPLAYHYVGLESGPHVVRVSNDNRLRVDAFQSNPAQAVPYLPIAEWWDNTPAGNGAPFFGTVGIAAGMTAGDLDGDGSVEIVLSADDVVNFGTLFVFRGDGGDTGDGDPILWSHDFGGGAYRTWVGSPAIADLDGQPGAEVVVAAGDELWAFHADGSTYWMTDTVSIFETLSAPAIGNLDLDPEPEIVANVGDTVEVREHDGTLAWSTAVPPHANPPILADLTGDGLLDLILTGWDDDVFVYDYNNGAPQLVWTVVLTSSMAGTFGAPAVADIDGDGSPEVIVSHYGALTVLNGEDGSLLWTKALDPGNAGGVSVADLDGDGEVEILTGMRYEFETGRFGMLYALERDGSLLWSNIAEDSSSANNAAVLDLNGDGAYEVAWNGKEQGFTIYNGVDGAILFNEPLANSATGSDYPIFVDVDGDSYAEIIVPTIRGVVVFGQDGVWGETRPCGMSTATTLPMSTMI
ncbi:MAG: FG-GAP-like repeat-containing protein [Chloroflexota bacterium]